MRGKNRIASPQCGFTFMEAMVTVAILAMGIVLIYQALLAALDYQNHLTHRLYAMNLLTDKFENLMREYQMTGELPQAESAKLHRVLLNNRPMVFQYTIFFDRREDLLGYAHVRCDISWAQNGRRFKLTRATSITQFNTED